MYAIPPYCREEENQPKKVKTWFLNAFKAVDHCTRDDLLKHAHEVLILDHDTGTLDDLRNLLGAEGLTVCTFTKPADLLAITPKDGISCLITDIHPADGHCGLQLYAKLQQLDWQIPTIFTTSSWEARTVVEAMRCGAHDFLTKPLSAEVVIEAVFKALENSWLTKRRQLIKREASALVASLSPRERQIIQMVAAGYLNKEIADRLELALITVKVHRSRAMQKLGAANAAELIRIANMAGFIS